MYPQPQVDARGAITYGALIETIMYPQPQVDARGAITYGVLIETIMYPQPQVRHAKFGRHRTARLVCAAKIVVVATFETYHNKDCRNPAHIGILCGTWDVEPWGKWDTEGCGESGTQRAVGKVGHRGLWGKCDTEGRGESVTQRAVGKVGHRGLWGKWDTEGCVESRT